MTRSRRSATLLVVLGLVVLGLVGGACSASDDGDPEPTTAGPTTAAVTVALPTAAPADFVAHGSVGQVWLVGAPASTELTLHGPTGVVATATTDAEGSLIFRNVAPGAAYAVTSGAGEARTVAEPVAVTAPDDAPPADFFTAQEPFTIDPDDNSGYGYLETRDGTTLAYSVKLPGPIADGPYPTVVEYSGYSPAAPGSPQPSSLIMQNLGYATVGVNIRGTGCSGGAFQFFEPLQGTDGYDAIETVAAQPWVLHGEVGMVGISYPAIAQLFTAQYQPPHLAAIAPLSVIDDTYRGTLYPGGIYNNGFAKDWAEERQRDAEPFGQGWSAERRDAGDQTCIDNQGLRGQNPSLADLIELVDFYEPIDVPVDNGFHSYDDLDGLAPATFVDRIDVPVFLAGAFQDEQTGGHFATMLDRFSSAPVTRFTLVNGNHTESLTPEVMNRWYEFLELYVARRVPAMPVGFRALGPATIGAAIWGSTVPLPEDRFDPEAAYDDVLAQYEAEDPVRILFENGAGCPDIVLGAPCPTFEASFSAWPIPETEARAWYLAGDGALADDVPAAGGSDRYEYAGDGQARMFAGGTDELWKGLPQLAWTQPEAGAAASYETAPLDETLVMAGSGSVDLWVGASQADVDVEVTLSEVRPDGTEYYVQVGWLRASHRALDESASTDLRPVHTHREADAADLPADEFVPLRVELFPFAHVFRAGSRVRLIVDVPGGSRPHWKFDIVAPAANASVELGWGGETPARIVMPVLSGLDADIPDAAPPCPALRGQPCRDYAAFDNTP